MKSNEEVVADMLANDVDEIQDDPGTEIQNSSPVILSVPNKLKQ